MYERIMVPLDGSNAAEMVLPYAEEIAIKFNAAIALVSVAEPAPAESDHLYRAYLKTIQEKVRAELSDWGARPGTRVDVEVLFGKPAEKILTYAANKNVSLVVMASRGRSGEGPWLLGNIASKVLRATTKPVLLIRKEAPVEGLQRKGLLRRILVPLDGSRVAEQIVPQALGLARVTEGDVILFHVYESLITMISGDALTPLSKEEAREANKHREEEAKGYLRTVSVPLREKGLMVSEVVACGNPADAILDYAESNAVDLIAMSTHGLSGIKRWVFGSITDKVLHAGDMPVLVVRATGRLKERPIAL
jgi:nucleotide-binding universal stress UspA family protein